MTHEISKYKENRFVTEFLKGVEKTASLKKDLEQVMTEVQLGL